MRATGLRISEERIIERFKRYLNGPTGRPVLQNLDEGESFVLQTSEHSLRVTKSGGKAVASVVKDSAEPWCV